MKRGARVWLATLVDPARGLGVRAAKLTGSGMRGDDTGPIWYSMRMAGYAHTCYWCVYGTSWRYLFPTRRSAQYEVRLHHQFAHKARAAARAASLEWAYAITAAVCAMRRKNQEAKR